YRGLGYGGTTRPALSTPGEALHRTSLPRRTRPMVERSCSNSQLVQIIRSALALALRRGGRLDEYGRFSSKATSVVERNGRAPRWRLSISTRSPTRVSTAKDSREPMKPAGSYICALCSL